MATVAAPHPEARGRDSDSAYNERFALISVLHELTVGTLELFDPRGSPDVFLERLAERLGCYATMLVLHDEARPTLQGASGLSPSSRAMPIPSQLLELLDGAGPRVLPYPEFRERNLVCWRFNLEAPPGGALILFFEGEPHLPARYRGILRQLAEILTHVFEHRLLFARTIENERRLNEKRIIIEHLSEASPDGVLFIDRSNETYFFNRRYVELWGIEEDAASPSLSMLCDAISKNTIDPPAFLAKAERLGDSLTTEIHAEIELVDGRTFDCHVRPVRSREGVSYGAALFFRDITERKRTEAERERLIETERSARLVAEEAIAARDNFLSVASHELRTPVTSLLLATQQLMRASHDPAIRSSGPLVRSLENAKRQAERLVRLVDALLDVSRIQSGHLQLEREDVDLAEVVSDVVSRLDHEIAQSGSPLIVRVEPPIVGSWDRSRLDQVVTNLISNAIKYGRGGRIDVTVTADDEHARLEVRDRGIGIAQEETSRLFNRFERAVSSRQYGGLGLGLFIVREIVELHGGTVEVQSEPGVGSTFTVVLPRRPRSAPANGQ